MKKILLVAIGMMSLFAVIGYRGEIIASANEVRIEKINPDSGVQYKLKRLKEKVILFFKFTPSSKVDYYQVLLDRRLGEFKYIVKAKNKAHIEKSSQRYETTAGLMAELIVSKNLRDKVESAKQLLNSHLLVLQDLDDVFPYSTAEYRFVMNDINSLKIYLDQLSAI